MSITWEDVHAAVSEHAGVFLKQAVCQNIAAALNEARPTRLSDFELMPPNCHSAIQAIVAVHKAWSCTFENPCAACVERRPHPHDSIG